MKTKTKNLSNLLSKREKQVMQLLLNGEKNKDISTLLELKCNTVSTYKKLIFYKLKVNNIIELYRINKKFVFFD